MEIKLSSENRFGVVAVKGGYITSEQLTDALKTQILEELKDDRHRIIGNILYEKEYITMPQIADVLVSMSKL
jgi:hypothetical protein